MPGILIMLRVHRKKIEEGGKPEKQLAQGWRQAVENGGNGGSIVGGIAGNPLDSEPKDFAKALIQLRIYRKK